MAIEIAGRQADVYAFWGETLDQARETIARVRASVAKAGARPGRHPLQPVLPPGPGGDRGRRLGAGRPHHRPHPRAARRPASGGPKPESVGSQRLLEAAAGGKVRDKRLWTEVAAAVGAGSNTTALVGTAEQVADSLADYAALGIDTFLIRGFDPLEDVARIRPRPAAGGARRGRRPRHPPGGGVARMRLSRRAALAAPLALLGRPAPAPRISPSAASA